MSGISEDQEIQAQTRDSEQSPRRIGVSGNKSGRKDKVLVVGGHVPHARHTCALPRVRHLV